MPKIIDDVKNTILNEAKKQVLENGYSSMTIRSVAKGCGIAVGTIYNYYPSKDVMTASFMLDDWMDAYERMRQGCESADTPSTAFACIYSELGTYSDKYDALFRDASAFKTSVNVFHERHKQLRSQIAGLIATLCAEQAKKPEAFLPEFIAEALLAWTTDKRPFKDVDAVLESFFI